MMSAEETLQQKRGHLQMSPPETATSYNAAVDFVDANVARGRSAKVAFVDPTRSLTYGALKERTDRFANATGTLTGLDLA